VVAFVQLHGAAPAPRDERIRLVHVPEVRKRHLEDKALISKSPYRNDDADVPVHDRAVRHALPALQQVRHDPRQPGEPRCPGLSLAVDGALRELHWYRDHPGTLRAGSPQQAELSSSAKLIG
jgi:hypothetical protein